MTHSRRLTVLLTAMTLVLVTPIAATAKPVSSYTLTHTQSSGLQTTSFELTLDEAGNGTLHFDHISFELIDCGDEIGSRTSTASYDGQVTSDEFSLDRKLSSFVWSGAVEVETEVTTSCSDAGLQVGPTAVAWDFSVVGTASDRLGRTRVDGARVLSSTLDDLTVEIDGSSYNGVGLLQETISRG
ncbi:MAG TPA: hypothetical protein VLB67_04620 [Acidimicrobiia bacterium]|nr:hypothetical protein [Acidimicrobiia bacterium]